MMNNQQKRLTSKRVADFFVWVSAGDELIFSKDVNYPSPIPFHQWTFIANVTDRYPLTDRVNQPLPEGLPIFCFPNGVELIKINKSPTFHTFVHTSEGGARMLGCCLTFYQKINDSQVHSIEKLINEHQLANPPTNIQLNNLYIPYCICLISHWTFVPSFKKFTCSLYQMSEAPCKIPIERYICNFIDDVPAPPAGRIDVTYYLGIHTHTLTTATYNYYHTIHTLSCSYYYSDL